MEEPLLSIIILDIQNHFLIQPTLESILSQADDRFEIIVITQNLKASEYNFLKNYLDRITLKEVAKDKKIPDIRNLALKLAKGRYLHYLFPGETYLSKFSLEKAFREIEEKKYPDLLCFAYIKRDLLSPPEVKQVSFNLSFLGGERYPMFTRDCFFSKQSLLEIGGFDSRYSGLEGFDAISHLFLKKGFRAVCFRNVLVDYELQKYPPRVMLRFLADMIAIIYRRYGFFRLFHFQIIKEMFDFFLYLLKDLKSHLVQKD